MKLGNYELDDIYCGDSAVMLAGLPDACIDLTVTSPPYDKFDGTITHPNGLRKYNGYSWDFTTIARQLYRVTKPGGVVVWVVGDATVNGSETGSSFRQALGFMGVGFNLHDTMIYQSDRQPLNGNRYEPKFEFMFVFSRGNVLRWNPLKEPSTYAGQKCAPKEYNQDGSKKDWWGSGIVKADKVMGNVWYIPSGKGKSTTDKLDHPGIFPEELARRHIYTWSNPGDVILDPFMGSGTVAKVSKMLGRHFIGFEISQEYVDLARRRVDYAPTPLPLFVENGQPKPEQTSMF